MFIYYRKYTFYSSFLIPTPLPGYKPLEYRIRDPSGRSGNAGGGVGVWVDNDLDCEILEDLTVFEPHFFESIFLKIKTGSNKFFILGNIYRPNTGQLANLRLFIERLNTIIATILSDPVLKKCDNIQLVGDFNINLLNYKSHSDTSLYVDSLLANGILPIITKPSRVFARSATLIDHILTTYKEGSIKSGIIETHISDHMPVFYIQDTSHISRPTKEIIARKVNAENINTYKKHFRFIYLDCCNK